MIKISLISCAFGLICTGYYIGTNSVAGQISCVIISICGAASALAWNELNKHEEMLKNDRRKKKRI